MTDPKAVRTAVGPVLIMSHMQNRDRGWNSEMTYVADPTPAWRRISRDVKLRAAGRAEQKIVAFDHDSRCSWWDNVQIRHSG